MLTKCQALLCVAAMLACNSGPNEERKPTGTPTDPVTECERHGLVCRIDKSRLGVCVQHKAPKSDPQCEGRFPCLVCAPQH